MKTADDPRIAKGTWLPVMEEFYTLQGEGHHTGKAAYFIRIGGCDNGCWWCDIKESWNARLHPLVEVDQIVALAATYPARSVVITGGEPLLYNMNYLCAGLRKKKIKTFLETSGSEPLSGVWDWICLSPKKDTPPKDMIYHIANELKVIITEPADFDWAAHNARLTGRDCLLYLQPEWSVRDTMMPLIVEYVKTHPEWAISLQSHKYMRIP